MNLNPDHREGVIFNHISDTQQGARAQFTDDWCMRAAADIHELAPYTDAHVHTGDCIEWFADMPEDEKYLAFREVVLGTGKPYADTPGNHDLSTYNKNSARRYRSADTWAQEVPKRGRANQVTLVGDDHAIFTISSDFWKWSDVTEAYEEPEPLTTALLAELDELLTLHAGRRVWLASHALPSTQLSDVPRFDGVLHKWADIEALVAAHPNIVGWFSGHWHIDVADPRSIRSIPVGGRRIWGVNAPSSAGLFPGATAIEHQFTRFASSLYVTDTGSDIIVRWRNHLKRQWVAPFGEFAKRYSHG